MTARKRVLLFLYLALRGSICLLVSTRLVVHWGEWYSGSIPYRMQTESLLRGRLVVSDNLADLLLDHTWSRDGMHQVWNLSVPLWCLPFEIAAKGVRVREVSESVGGWVVYFFGFFWMVVFCRWLFCCYFCFFLRFCLCCKFAARFSRKLFLMVICMRCCCWLCFFVG